MANILVTFINGEERVYSVSDDFRESSSEANGFIAYDDGSGKEILINVSNILSIEEQ